MNGVEVERSPERGIILARLGAGGDHSLSQASVEALHDALTLAEREGRILALAGRDGTFCNGMDLQRAAVGEGEARRFQELLDRIAGSAAVVVSVVDGAAVGGGVGVAAASDFVYASERSTFTLPEARMGLLPFVVVPYLMRRTGFQRAYTMTLSTEPVRATQAQSAGLVDVVVAEPERLLQRLAVRMSGVDARTVLAAKRYFGTLSVVTDRSGAAATAELERSMEQPRVRAAIAQAVERRSADRPTPTAAQTATVPTATHDAGSSR